MKKEIINIRVTDSEKKELQIKADKMGMNISQFIRFIALYNKDHERTQK